jgi:hypothetical protein
MEDIFCMSHLPTPNLPGLAPLWHSCMLPLRRLATRTTNLSGGRFLTSYLNHSK